MTVGQRLIEKGRKQGREEGREEGSLLGQRALLNQMLDRRFGALPPEVAERLAAATHDDLDRWADRFVTAATLDDVFTDGPRSERG